MTSTTAAMAPTANPCMKGRLTMKSPSSEMITVHPAKRTARPDVARDCTTAALGSRPSWSPCRYRVTMNRA